MLGGTPWNNLAMLFRVVRSNSCEHERNTCQTSVSVVIESISRERGGDRAFCGRDVSQIRYTYWSLIHLLTFLASCPRERNVKSGYGGTRSHFTTGVSSSPPAPYGELHFHFTHCSHVRLFFGTVSRLGTTERSRPHATAQPKCEIDLVASHRNKIKL